MQEPSVRPPLFAPHPCPVVPDEGSVIAPLLLIATVCPSFPQDTARSIMCRAWEH